MCSLVVCDLFNSVHLSILPPRPESTVPQQNSTTTTHASLSATQHVGRANTSHPLTRSLHMTEACPNIVSYTSPLPVPQAHTSHIHMHILPRKVPRDLSYGVATTPDRGSRFSLCFEISERRSLVDTRAEGVWASMVRNAPVAEIYKDFFFRVDAALRLCGSMSSAALLLAHMAMSVCCAREGEFGPMHMTCMTLDSGIVYRPR